MTHERRYSERYMEIGHEPMTADEIGERLGIKGKSGSYQFLTALKIKLAVTGSPVRLHRLPPREGEEAMIWQLREK